MVVKEIPTETQKNTDLKIIEEAMYDSMAGFYGRNNLSWINCLFNYELKEQLDIEKGMIHHYHGHGIDEVEKLLHQNGIYGCYGDPKALLYTKKLPKGFSLFIIGPGYNNQGLEIVCSSPKINLRDFEEASVIQEINSKTEELIRGKHKNIEGKINLIGPPVKPLEGVILYKLLKMPVEPGFLFRKDIEDIQTFAQIYNNFFEYQKQRDESFKNAAEKIVEEILDKEKEAGNF